MLTLEHNARTGAGGNATVYRAQSSTREAPVALKVAHVATPETQRLMRREFNALKALETSGYVPRAYACKTVCAPEHPDINGKPGIEMEYLEGKTLSAMTALRTLTQREAIAVALHACRAGTFIQNKGILFRDFHPGNIFITNAGQLKVIDFGTAICFDEISSATKDCLIMNGCQSPEAASSHASWNAASDVYGLGATISTALHRHILDHAHAPYAPFDRWIARCVQPDPRDRFATCEEAYGALLNVACNQAKPLRRIARFLFEDADVPDVQHGEGEQTRNEGLATLTRTTWQEVRRKARQREQAA